MGSTISIDNLQVEIGEILSSFANECQTVVDEVGEELAKDAVKKLEKSSPVGNSNKHYAKSWTIEKRKGKTVVYNKKYRLTHLLEKGHNIVRNKKVVGYAEPKIHIKPVEEYCQEEYVKRVTEKIERGIL